MIRIAYEPAKSIDMFQSLASQYLAQSISFSGKNIIVWN